jgi:RsiW-degrading membrane proteinase PrsW (M82 family)
MSALNLSLLGLALLPSCIIMFLVLKNVKHKREPFKKIAQVFGISAISVIPAIILENIGDVVLAVIYSLCGADAGNLTEDGMMFYYLLEYIFVVGISEEACKFFTFKWIIFNDREFDNTYDGVIYGAASALGFATLENIMYVFMSDDSLTVALIRAVTSIPMHAITGIFMGYYFGISKYRKYNNIMPDTHPERSAFIFSVLLHGLYDFVVTLPEIYSESGAVEIMSDVLLVIVMICIYLLMGLTIRRAKRETHNIYNRYYYEQLGGNIQDMFGKTSAKRPMFFGIPFGYPPQNPYRNQQPPYGNYTAPPPQYGYRYGTQQPFNPYTQPMQQPYTQQYYNTQTNYQNVPPQANQGMGMGMGNVTNANTYANSNQNANANPNVYVRRPNVVTAVPNPQAKPPKRCASCGNAVSQTAKFCNICGQPLDK